MNRDESSKLTGAIVDSAVKVHKALGPGLLESAYHACLAHELRTREINVRVNVPLQLTYDGVELPVGYHLDMLVGDAVVVELKAVRQLHPLHEAQLLSYLRLTNLHVGLLINFHVVYLRDGIKRLVNNW